MNVTGRLAGALAVGLVLVRAPAVNGLASADDSAVIVTRPGVVFHAVGSDDVRGQGHEKPMSEALASGYAPCKLCFGRQISTSQGAGGVAATSTSTAFSLSAGRGVVIAPGKSSSSVSQPFGLKAPSGRSGSEASHGIKNPYVLKTIRFPGFEQGAYETR